MPRMGRYQHEARFRSANQRLGRNIPCAPAGPPVSPRSRARPAGSSARPPRSRARPAAI